MNEAAVAPHGVRSHGIVRATFVRTCRGTSRDRLHQSGGLRLLFPRAHGARCEAVLINTGGGMAGGDRWDLRFELDPGAQATLTSQSAERIYRAQSGPAVVATRIALAAGAEFEWLPQETIFFDGARLQRSMEVEMAGDACLTIVESVVFGRARSGEHVVSGTLHDRWRVRRGGRLVFAEDLRAQGDITALLDRPGCGDGARAVAIILVVAADAEARLEPARIALAAACDADATVEWGASAWDGKLVVRLAGADARAVRDGVTAFLTRMRQRPLPRVWQ